MVPLVVLAQSRRWWETFLCVCNPSPAEKLCFDISSTEDCYFSAKLRPAKFGSPAVGDAQRLAAGTPHSFGF